MHFLWRAESHFNLANLVTMINISAGLIAVYMITQHLFIAAIVLAWIGGICDIIDGKIARRYKLSNPFGIQLDSFADFLSFVLVPTFLIFEAVYRHVEFPALLVCAGVSIYYVISGLRRLIAFNLGSVSGEVARYFIGVPTPLGAILLWLVYLGFIYGLLPQAGVMAFMVAIGYLLNSKVKIPHP